MTEARTWLTVALAQQSGASLMGDPRTIRTLSGEAIDVETVGFCARRFHYSDRSYVFADRHDAWVVDPAQVVL